MCHTCNPETVTLTVTLPTGVSRKDFLDDVYALTASGRRAIATHAPITSSVTPAQRRIMNSATLLLGAI